MFRKFISSVLLILSALTVKAQGDTVKTNDAMPAAAHIIAATLNPAVDSSHLRVSLITCGVGDELYASFGHTAVRVIDSASGTDIVYNYGTFSFDDDFYPKFVRGKLLYYVSDYDFAHFPGEYIAEKRSIFEQELLITGAQKIQISDFLKHNARPENREYKYDFLFDNCATRIRDIFPKSLGEGFKWGQALPATSKLTYRNIIDQYLQNKHWERFGIDLVLGSPIDSVMTNEGSMFLPDYLRDGLKDATLNGEKVAGPVVQLLPGSEESPSTINQPLVLTSVIALLTILGLAIPSLRVLGKVMSSILLFISGLLGVFFLFMWFGTDHQSCQNNYNVLWGLPPNLWLAFARPKGAGRYAVIAIFLLVVSLFLHVFKVQGLPLLELGPILLSLVFVYGTIYKRSKQ